MWGPWLHERPNSIEISKTGDTEYSLRPIIGVTLVVATVLSKVKNSGLEKLVKYEATFL